ncbi:Zn-dependent peptidase ImmA (M78 family)/DNA-binding XRE family transcriptional regulator [Rhizobium sp. BIGb0125]|uniref:helix-turn-helix domain-containing protein n=1 Tax=Rhizobium sp. BIGb0125 TaxID=2940618 RepID=UPI0021697D26|nr:XRE family transcriptional regulator [Rhizobium sp. BIGb0125]MCS4243815.1 Zn-dependent peptidase ImmA (M78 family)/DNA-binding XRE family transcriptional regulator [Rhizobium sp. BIGb0125]
MGDNTNIVRFPSAARDTHHGRRLIPARLLEARLASRLNQTELATKIGVSRQAISFYEQGVKAPEPETMQALASALEQPVSFFTKADIPTFGGHSVNFFRKTGADTKRRNMACEVYARWLAQAAYTFDDVVNFPNVDLPSFEPSGAATSYSDEEIEEIAEKIRQHFGLGLGPISNVVRLLETKGVLIARVQIPKENVEAFSFWSGGRPFIFLASEKESGARARFDAAHELGHLILHRWIGADEIEDKDRLKEIESEADRFAGAFLLPRKSFPNEVYSSRLMAFVDLKRRWKVSVQAMIYRCKNLGIFDDQQVTNLYKQLSFKKWRKTEPLDGPNGLPLEEPMLLRKISEVVLDGGRMAKDEVKMALGFSPRIIEQLLGLPPFQLSSGDIRDFEPTLK